MNRRTLLVAVAASTFYGDHALADTDTHAGTEIDQDVARLLKVMEDSWNASDIELMFSTATPDIHWVNVVGMHWQGLEAVKKAHQVYFDVMFRGVPLKLEAVESVKRLPGGVVVTVVRWHLGNFRTPSGQDRGETLNRMSILAVPAAEGLRISHVANIEIDTHAAAFNPIKS